MTLFYYGVSCCIFVTVLCYSDEFSDGYHYRRAFPQEVMVDVINNFGLALLEAHNEDNENNIALSPYGATSVLVALGEGIRGYAAKEIQEATRIPLDATIVRVGLRDIHRHLKSYFIPKEGFLAGLTLSNEKVPLIPRYEEILRFYGYDSDSFNNPLYPDMFANTSTIKINYTTLATTTPSINQISIENNDITTVETPSTIESRSEITESVISTTQNTLDDKTVSVSSNNTSVVDSINTTMNNQGENLTLSTTPPVNTSPLPTNFEEDFTTVTPTAFKDTATTESIGTLAELLTTTESKRLPDNNSSDSNVEEVLVPTTLQPEMTLDTMSKVPTTIIVESMVTKDVEPLTTKQEMFEQTGLVIPTTVPTNLGITTIKSLEALELSDMTETMVMNRINLTTPFTTINKDVEIMETTTRGFTISDMLLSNSSTITNLGSSTAKSQEALELSDMTESDMVVKTTSTTIDNDVEIRQTTTIEGSTISDMLVTNFSTTTNLGGTTTKSQEPLELSDMIETDMLDNTINLSTSFTAMSEVPTTITTESMITKDVKPVIAKQEMSELAGAVLPMGVPTNLGSTTAKFQDALELSDTTETMVMNMINLTTPSTTIDNDVKIMEITTTEGSTISNLPLNNFSTITNVGRTTANSQEDLELSNMTESDMVDDTINLTTSFTSTDSDVEIIETTTTRGSTISDMLLNKLSTITDLRLDTPTTTSSSISEDTTATTSTIASTSLDTQDELSSTVNDNSSEEATIITSVTHSISKVTTTYETSSWISTDFTQGQETSTFSDIDASSQDTTFTKNLSEGGTTDSMNVAGTGSTESFSEAVISTEVNVANSTEKTDDEKSKRGARSVIDYVIARYYDNFPNSRDPYERSYKPKEELSFLVYGKFKETNINFMTYDAVLPIAYIPVIDAFALSFPLDSKEYYLLLLLPAHKTEINKVIYGLKRKTSLRSIISSLRYTHVRAIIPSFMLKGYVVLTPTLQKLGISRIFEPRHTDFSLMTNERDIYVTNVEQAVTVTIRNYVDPENLPNYRNLQQFRPIEFKADHPFLYFVMDTDIHVNLMAGKIVNPLNSRIR